MKKNDAKWEPRSKQLEKIQLNTKGFDKRITRLSVIVSLFIGLQIGFDVCAVYFYLQ